MLEYDRIDTGKELISIKQMHKKECDIYQYWYVLDWAFKYEPYLCNCCQNLM